MYNSIYYPHYSSMHIVTDCSASPAHNISVGSYLFLDDMSIPLPEIENKIKNIKFNSRSSTIIELHTIGYTFNYINTIYGENPRPPQFFLYTDCENFIKLITGRKDTIKKTDDNYDLYMYLINTVEKFKINAIWTKGHCPEEYRTEHYQNIFSLVDKNARRVLRETIRDDIDVLLPNL